MSESQTDKKARRRLDDKLAAQQEQAAGKLYSADPRMNKEQHQQLQDQYNQILRQRHELTGSRTPFVQKQDVRHELDPGKVEYEVHPDGSMRETRTLRMPLHDPGTVINWRSTKIGEAADKKLRAQCTKREGAVRDGDHSGHHIGLQFGVDPAESRNLSRQNGIQNGGKGTYYDAEKRAARLAKQNPNGRYFIEVKEIRYSEKYGANRPISRDFRVTDEHGQTIDDDGRVLRRKDRKSAALGQSHLPVASVGYVNSPVRGSEAARQAQAESPNWQPWRQQQPPDSGATRSKDNVFPISRQNEIRTDVNQPKRNTDSISRAFGNQHCEKSDEAASKFSEGLNTRGQHVAQERQKPNLSLVKSNTTTPPSHKPKL